MKLFILNQNKDSLVIAKDKIKINRKKEIVHGKDVLGQYDSLEECKKVLLEITSCINKIHQFTDENKNVVMAFASTSELYEMPSKLEIKE